MMRQCIMSLRFSDSGAAGRGVCKGLRQRRLVSREPKRRLHEDAASENRSFAIPGFQRARREE